MTAPRTRKPAATKPAPRTKSKAAATKPKRAPRTKSGLTKIGDAAMREALLDALVRHRWSYPAVAEELTLSDSSHVLRQIRQLGLAKELTAARKAGLVKPGPRTT